LGGIRALRRNELTSPVQIHGLDATGIVSLGGDLLGQSANNNTIWFRARRQRQNESHLESRGLSGNNITRAALHTWLGTMFSLMPANMMPEPGWVFCPIIGSVRFAGSFTFVSDEMMTWLPRVINISYLGRRLGTEWWLYGMGIDGNRYSVIIPNSGANMILRNRGTGTGAETGTNAGNFANITVDLALV